MLPETMVRVKIFFYLKKGKEKLLTVGNRCSFLLFFQRRLTKLAKAQSMGLPR